MVAGSFVHELKISTNFLIRSTIKPAARAVTTKPQIEWLANGFDPD
jgi:hypothetical protein